MKKAYVFIQNNPYIIAAIKFTDNPIIAHKISFYSDLPRLLPLKTNCKRNFKAIIFIFGIYNNYYQTHDFFKFCSDWLINKEII